MPIPKNNEIRLEVTTRCNYNCVICPRDKMTRRMDTMSLELFKKLFDKIAAEAGQYDTFTFSGIGEPLLDEGINKKIEYVKKHNDMHVLILTNASQLSVSRFKELQSLGVNSIRVSFYGIDAASYSKMHGVKNDMAFSVVRDNLVEICRIKDKASILITLNVLDEQSLDYVNEWIKFWNNRANLIEVWRPHNWVDCKHFRQVQAERINTCGRPFNGPLQVQADGTVIMCCFDFDGKLILGDLKTQTLQEIFSSPMYNKLVECHTSGNFKASGLICENCDQRNKDKSEVMIYNSKFDIKERVKQFSTTYKNLSG